MREKEWIGKELWDKYVRVYFVFGSSNPAAICYGYISLSRSSTTSSPRSSSFPTTPIDLSSFTHKSKSEILKILSKLRGLIKRGFFTSNRPNE